jgi:hypothetical protein
MLNKHKLRNQVSSRDEAAKAIKILLKFFGKFCILLFHMCPKLGLLLFYENCGI